MAGGHAVGGAGMGQRCGRGAGEDERADQRQRPGEGHETGGQRVGRTRTRPSPDERLIMISLPCRRAQDVSAHTVTVVTDTRALARQTQAR